MSGGWLVNHSSQPLVKLAEPRSADRALAALPSR